VIYNVIMQPNTTQIHDFRETVQNYYAQHGRHDMPWRQAEADGSFDPYKILVSELMLQQTQVARVIPKYQQFLELFPTVQDLASSSLAAVLTIWSGLGYNRRAKFLHQAAKQINGEYGGKFPHQVSELVKLPGIGPNTAGAIAAYAFNQPVVFIETNIRTVYIHHFFMGRQDVPDKELKGYAEATLDTANPRLWFWALMDYGAFLKQSVGNLNKLSKHYSVQSRFEGSKRQVRGQVIRALAINSQQQSELAKLANDPRLLEVLADLEREGLIVKHGTIYSLTA
jgi:A/G-specific adenine glycosylase